MSSSSSLEPQSALMQGVPSLVFIATFLLLWISLSPFGDLGSARILELSSGNETLTYALFALLAAFSGFFMLKNHLPALRSLFNWPYLLLFGWGLLTMVLSLDFSMSLRRFVLFCLVLILSASLFLIARDRQHLARLIAIPLTLMVVLSYLGVLFFPHLAVHQATDVLEPHLAGDWRGVFPHKNMAGAGFALASFMALYVARCGNALLGWSLTLACALFVLMSGSKSSTMLMLTVAVITPLALSLGSTKKRLVVLLAPLLLLNAVGIGSTISPALQAVSRLVPLESTFTGRTDIWVFGVDKIMQRPVTGYGFGAFWDTTTTKYGGEDSHIWAGNAAHGHNSYMDTALTMGLPGLFLSLFVFVALPLRDLTRALHRGTDPALVQMMTHLWLFTLYVSSFETVFYARSSSAWIIFLFSVFSLRYLSLFSMKPDRLTTPL